MDGITPEKLLLEMSNQVIFAGNEGIDPVSRFEPRWSFSKAMPSRCAGKLPLIWLLEMSRSVAHENVYQNQSGNLSTKPVFEMLSESIPRSC